MEWQPIETAPMDGAEVLLSCPVQEEGVTLVVAGFWMPLAGWKAALLMRGSNTWNRGNARPTHWMPLPDPPETE